MEKTQREWFRQQFKSMAAAGKEHKPLRKDITGHIRNGMRPMIQLLI